MLKLAKIAWLIGIMTVAFSSSAARAEPAKKPALARPRAPDKSGLLPINGVDYYYEIHGRGEPLLLHGGLGSIEMFGPVLKLLAKDRKVIAVDLHGHGRTALGQRPFRLESIGDDMAALVEQLGHESVDLYQLLGGGLQDPGWNRETMARNRLAILPDVTHYEMFSTPRLALAVLPFLNAQSDAKSWASQVSKR